MCFSSMLDQPTNHEKDVDKNGFLNNIWEIWYGNAYYNASHPDVNTFLL